MLHTTNKTDIFSVICLLTLTAFASSPLISIAGARTGLLLWFNNIVPTLLPFITIINLLDRLGGFMLFRHIFGLFFQKILHLNPYYASIVIPGIICGYPSGAVCAVNMYDSGIIKQHECEFLCIISSFISPMFLSGYVLTAQKGNIYNILAIIISVYAPRIILLPIFKKIYHIKCPDSYSQIDYSDFNIKDNIKDKVKDKVNLISLIDDAITSSFQIILRVGGYIIMCSVLTEYIIRLSFKTPAIKALILCIVEITNGINYTYSVINIPIICNLIIVMSICFSGICINMQVLGVSKKAGISSLHYLLSKLCESIIGGVIYIIYICLV